MRLIDTDKLCARMSRNATPYFTVPDIENAPTVDAVVVTRCKDCKYHYDCGVHFCDRLGMDCPDDSDFFCSYGKRKEEPHD